MSSVGSIRDALEGAMDTLAASVAFQDRIGVQTTAEARDRILLDQVQNHEGLHVIRPFALLKIASRGSNQVSEGIAIDLVAGGSIILYLTDNARMRSDHEQSYLDFLGFAGKVIDEMEEKSGFNDYLPFHDTEMLIAPLRTPPSERSPLNDPTNDYWEVAFMLNYGNMD